MSRISLLIVAFFGFILTHGQILDSMFVNMPSRFAPFIEKSQRLDLLDFAQANQRPIILNVFGDTCLLEIYSKEYLKLKLSAASTLEMKLVDSTHSQPYLVTCETVCAGGCDSKLNVYDTAWNKVDFPQLTAMPSISEFTKEPTQLQAITNAYPFPLIKASLSQESNHIEFLLDIGSLIPKREWDQIKPLLQGPVKRPIDFTKRK